jgi:hypothetical protein
MSRYQHLLTAVECLRQTFVLGEKLRHGKTARFLALVFGSIVPLASVGACSADNAADDVSALRQISKPPQAGES